MHKDQFKQLVQSARPTSEADYASERQVDAENAVYHALEEILTPDEEANFSNWALKATTEEILDHAEKLFVQAFDRNLIRREFPDFPIETIPAGIPDWMECNAWHNDTCPIWADANGMTIGEGLFLSVDWPNPADREYSEGKRFCVWRYADDEEMIITDDFSEALRQLNQWKI